jgi:putative FmdB family regulatory protein
VPLYEYVCKKCKHRFEKIQKFSDRLVKKCPECGGPVERPLSAPAVHFKGSGFYVNDYNARKGVSDGDSGGSTREKREKEEKKQEASDKSEKNDKAEKSEKSDDKSKKTTAKKSADKD